LIVISVSIQGKDGVTLTLAKLIPASREAVLDLAERVHELSYHGADKHTKKGALIRSLGGGPKAIKNGWIVGHDLDVAPHAAFVHWGTKAHVIRPKDKQALRWSIGGRFIFAKFVNHPGYKGDPWLVKATDDALRTFNGIVDQSMRNI
jgi:hypothetical protein